MRSVIHDVGDRVVVSFRPRRRWSVIVFLVAWLAGWTLGGILAAGQATHVSPGVTAFLLIWLSLWLCGEVFAVGTVLWMLRGRELLTATPEWLELRWELGPLARTQRFDAPAVQRIGAERVPHDEDEKPRDDFGLRISCVDDRLHFGEGVSEHEAEQIALAVEARLHPRSWWDDRPQPSGAAPATATVSAGRFVVTEPSHTRAKIAYAVLAGGVAGAGALLAALF
jgi:hypothetical protein